MRLVYDPQWRIPGWDSWTRIARLPGPRHAAARIKRKPCQNKKESLGLPLILLLPVIVRLVERKCKRRCSGANVGGRRRDDRLAWTGAVASPDRGRP